MLRLAPCPLAEKAIARRHLDTADSGPRAESNSAQVKGTRCAFASTRTGVGVRRRTAGGKRKTSVGIQQSIGHRPIAAFGNSDGDLEERSVTREKGRDDESSIPGDRCMGVRRASLVGPSC